jgi:uncharacterized protein
MEAGGIAREPTAGQAAGARAAAPTRVLAVTSDPGPLGLAAFALTTLVLSLINANLISKVDLPVVFALALTYGGLTQLLAGMWEFRTGNTFGAVAFSSYGAFWLSFWALGQFFLKGIPKPAQDHALAVYLIGWGIFTAYMFIASLRTTAAISLVFILLAATFIVLGIGNANASTNTIKIGGWLGIVTAGAAWYASFAAVVNSTFAPRTILPVIPLRR